MRMKLNGYRPLVMICCFLIISMLGAGCGKRNLLKVAYQKNFVIGVAMNHRQIAGEEPKTLEIIETHFNSITAENDMKWDSLNPDPGEFNFDYSDRFVDYGLKYDMSIIGHVLVWDHRTPEWVFKGAEEGENSKAMLLANMRRYIYTVAGRYQGRIHGWDVVNEAIDKDGRMRKNRWYAVLGESYITKAFQYANEAAPDAELYYNDFDLTAIPKREAVVKLVERLREKGVRIDGIGMQGHYSLTYPKLNDLEASICRFAELGLKVMITELDITIHARSSDQDTGQGSEKASPTKSNDTALAERYAELFRIFIKHSDKISRVTFWGVHDAQSWLNSYPVKDRDDSPLLFGRDFQPKPAFDAILKIAPRGNSGGIEPCNPK